jgi:hypothetical protein
MFTITIKKEVEVRHCTVVERPDGLAVVTIYCDSIVYTQPDPEMTVEQALRHCEDVQLGGAVDWTREGNTWTSTTVLVSGGDRLTPAECELARQAMRRASAASPEGKAELARGRRALKGAASC